MKNIKTFEEFVNESILNESFSGPAKANIKKIGDITRKFLEKDLPKLLDEYGCTMRLNPANKTVYIIDHPMQQSLFDIYLNKMNKNRFAIVLMYAYVNVFMGPRDHREKLPFSIGHPGEARNWSGGSVIDDALSGWQTLEGDDEDNTRLSNPDVVSQYQETANNWLEGIRKNLEYYVKHNVIKN